MYREDARLRRLAESRRDREEAVQQHREIRAAEVVTTRRQEEHEKEAQRKAEQEEEEDEEKIEERRRRIRERALQRREEEEVLPQEEEVSGGFIVGLKLVIIGDRLDLLCFGAGYGWSGDGVWGLANKEERAAEAGEEEALQHAEKVSVGIMVGLNIGCWRVQTRLYFCSSAIYDCFV